MKFTVNGKSRDLPGQPTVGDYIRQLGINPLAVAVEMNGRIVKREQFDQTAIPQDARLEVVRMMGGG